MTTFCLCCSSPVCLRNSHADLEKGFSRFAGGVKCKVRSDQSGIADAFFGLSAAPQAGIPMARTILLALLPFARCHSGSKPGALQPETPYTDAAKLNDLGAEFASTSPLVGRTIPFNWTDAVLETFPTAACAALEAAVDRHLCPSAPSLLEAIALQRSQHSSSLPVERVP